MLTQFPKTIQAGISLNCDIITPDYPAPDWTVTAYIRGPSVIDLVASGSDTTHSLAAAAAATSAWQPGQYSVSVRAAAAADVFEIEGGALEILADVSAAGAGFDPRTHAKKVLESIEAVLEGRATKDQQSYKINNRELVRTDIADLLKLRETYRAEVAREAAGGRSRKLLRRQVRVKF